MKHSVIRVLCLFLCALLLAGCAASPKSVEGSLNLESFSDIFPIRTLGQRIDPKQQYVKKLLNYAQGISDQYTMGEVRADTISEYSVLLNYKSEPALEIRLILGPQNRVLRSRVRVISKTASGGGQISLYSVPAFMGITNIKKADEVIKTVTSYMESQGIEEDAYYTIEDMEGYLIGVWLICNCDENMYEVEIFRPEDFNVE